MKQATTTILFSLLALLAMANDSMWYTSGNQLVPMQATNISVAKEILTITLPDYSNKNQSEGEAKVDVYYEFYNDGAAQTVTVGFEAEHPYMEEEDGGPAKDKKHPNIKGFSVVMNGQKLLCKNEVRHFTTQDNYADYTYVYSFKAYFKPGKNIVRHTYRFTCANGIDLRYGINYMLSPATRWKGNKIGDFTLRLIASEPRHFLMSTAPFSTVAPAFSGTGRWKNRVLDVVNPDETTPSHYQEIFMRKATAEWHILDFAPQQELSIISPEQIRYLNCRTGGAAINKQNLLTAEDRFLFLDGSEAWRDRVLRNIPFAAQGYVFKDKQLRALFESQWWYIPNPNYK